MLMLEFLAKNKTIIMPQPSFLKDLAPADFFLFPKLKTPRKGKHFAKIEEIKEKSKQELLAILKSTFSEVFRGLEKNAGISVLYLKGVTLKGTR